MLPSGISHSKVNRLTTPHVCANAASVLAASASASASASSTTSHEDSLENAGTPTSSEAAGAGALSDQKRRLKLKRTKPRSYDVRTGHELLYASGEAQRAHWPSIKHWSRPLSDRDHGIATGRKWWAPPPLCEASLLFRDATMIPFDDHDVIRRLELPLATQSSPVEPTYPMPMALAAGVASRPSPPVCAWLEIGCAVARALPDYMHTWLLDDTRPSDGDGGGRAGGGGGGGGVSPAKAAGEEADDVAAAELTNMNPKQALDRLVASRGRSLSCTLQLDSQVSIGAPVELALTFDPVLLDTEVRPEGSGKTTVDGPSTQVPS